jgi:hypothetical protein
VGLQDLVPSPYHVTIHIVRNFVMSSEEKCLILQNSSISGGNSASVDCFGVGS